MWLDFFLWLTLKPHLRLESYDIGRFNLCEFDRHHDACAVMVIGQNIFQNEYHTCVHARINMHCTLDPVGNGFAISIGLKTWVRPTGKCLCKK